jgi:hypothetical protein
VTGHPKPGGLERSLPEVWEISDVVKQGEERGAARGGKPYGDAVKRLTPFWRAVIETGFIIFLFYSNLLMGEFTRSNSAHGKTLDLALQDIFTVPNFAIAVISALIGYSIVEYLRKKL